MTIDNDGNPLDDGYCGTHQWQEKPCPECATAKAAQALLSGSNLFANCALCTAEFMSLGTDSEVCPRCDPIVPQQTGLL